MPKIKRSIDYTFEAYSGVDEQENNGSQIHKSASNVSETDENSKLMSRNQFHVIFVSKLYQFLSL